MKSVVLLAWTAAATLNAACADPSVEAPLHDRIRAAAQTLRWTKGDEAHATVPLDRFGRPVVVLALPPGRYRLSDLEPLLSGREARAWLSDWIRDATLDVDRPSIYIFQPRRAESAHYEHLSMRRPLALWKEDDGPLDVLLRRVDDDVEMVSLK
jgi:hypothetical protein